MKATARPSAESAEVDTERSPTAPARPVARFARAVVAASRSRTKRSLWGEGSAAERLSAVEPNATTRPSAEIEAANELPSPPAPPADADWRLTRVVVWACRSRTKTSFTAASSDDRLSANESNTT